MSCTLILQRKAPKAYLQNIYCEFTSVQNQEFNNLRYSGCKSKNWLLEPYLKVQFCFQIGQSDVPQMQVD